VVRVDSKRDDWCRLENFEDMYNGVYEKLADACIAEVLYDEVLLDRHINSAQTEADAYRRKIKYSLKHTEKLIFVDEVGDTNISQKGDGNAGGQKVIVATDTIEQL
jgi:hypothetical protein